ncbi:MAG: tRNA dihydrouridine synthase DusB [Candidatus Omnitrophica bacterium]|nr:tRNA dihydrouridine synthase DusB [Candidatus Omnitrophota bacterium]
MFTLGDIKLNTPVISPPLAGISSHPFRALNRKFGCEFSFLEMINCRSLVYSSNKTGEMMRFTEEELPLGIQLLVENEGLLLKVLEKIHDLPFSIVDLNAACPQKKVTSRGEGAHLLKTPKKLERLLKLMVKNCVVPVSLKMRLGWSDDSRACDIALSGQDAGIKAIFIHGRTKAQGYSGEVCYKAIARIKKKLKVPVIASGDILSAGLAKKMFDETGCDAVTVARGALGNPWIFREIKEYLEKGKILERPCVEDIIKTMRSHLKLSCDFYGPKRGLSHFKKFFIWYTRSFKGVRLLRGEITKLNTVEGAIDMMSKFKKIGLRDQETLTASKQNLPQT